MSDTNTINKVLDRAATLYSVWQITENDTDFFELYGMAEAISIMLNIEHTEAMDRIRDHKDKRDEGFDF